MFLAATLVPAPIESPTGALILIVVSVIALATLVPTRSSVVSLLHRPTPHRLSDAQLCCAWRTTSMALQMRTAPDERLAIAVWREEYLNEMESRNAAGFRAWIDDGECSDAALEGFLVRDKTAGT